MSEPANSDPADWRRIFTAAERARMLDDIASVSLAVGARLFPGQDWQDLDVTAHSVAARKSPVERLGFIEHLLPRLMQTVRQIEHSPLTQTVSETRPIVPPIRAKRVGTAALMAALRHGPNLRTLEETVTTLSQDTPENRAVRAFCEVLVRDCLAIEQMARAEDETEAAQRAAHCARQLRSLWTAEWWSEVPSDRAAWTRPPTQRAFQRPEYASVFRAMARYRRGFRFDWDQPLFTLPPRETWRLYEVWCLVQTLEAVNSLGWEIEHGEWLAVREGRLAFTLAVGEPSRVTLRSLAGRRLWLSYNPTFAEGKHSLSHTMQPDIALADGCRLWLLDAKFKAYALPGEEGEDINQMHAYRDAIVDTQGRRTVGCAWCLYAGQSDATNRPHITYRRSAETTPVGALCLRPGDEAMSAHLRALLAGWLSQSMETQSMGTVPPVSPQT